MQPDYPMEPPKNRASTGKLGMSDRLPRLVAVDLDGTLLGPDKRISAGDRGALRRAAAAGAALLVATGRGLHSARPILEALPVPAYAALHNGALVLDPGGAELWRVPVPPRAVAAVLPLVRAGGLHPMLYAGAAHAGAEITLVLEPAARDSPYTQEYLRTKSAILELVDDVAGARRRGVLGIVSFGPRSAVLAAAAAVAPLHGLVQSWWGPAPVPPADLFEVVAPGGTKGGALRRLTERLGLTPQEVMAIGDNANDLDMLRYAGTAVAMANASAEVRAAAHFVTTDNASGGVAHALAQVGLAPPPGVG